MTDKKVYCKDCTKFNSFDSDWCAIPSKLTDEALREKYFKNTFDYNTYNDMAFKTAIGRDAIKKELTGRPSKLNADNKCPFYKEKFSITKFLRRG